MYFEATATNVLTGKTRFENLDSIEEVQTFAEVFQQQGFLLLEVKSFDENGFRKYNKYTYCDDLRNWVKW